MHAALLALAGLGRPARVELASPAPIAISLIAERSVWRGEPGGLESGQSGGAAAVPRAARPSPRARLKRGPLVARPTSPPASRPTEATPADQPPADDADGETESETPDPGDSPGAAGGGGKPGPGTGGEGTGPGAGDPFTLNPRFRWVWKLDRGRYRLFIPAGYALELVMTFESIIDNRLEVTSLDGEVIASFSKRGPVQWSYPAQPRTRVLILRGPDRHDCRYGQVDLRARVGFEDSTDRDCNEPELFLRLVRP